MCGRIFPYENIAHELKDGYKKDWRYGWMRGKFDLQGKGVHLNIEDKYKRYALVVNISTYQSIDGELLQIHKYVILQRFKMQPGKFYLINNT